MIAAGAWTLWIIFSDANRLDSQMLKKIRNIKARTICNAAGYCGNRPATTSQIRCNE